jgi:hypothetical protein
MEVLDRRLLLLLGVCAPMMLRQISTLTQPSIMAQVFVVVAAGSVIAFIIRDLGEPAIAGWVIQVLCFLLRHITKLKISPRDLCLCKVYCHLS